MVIVWEKGSGLCNRLFVSAYGLSLAKAAGQRLINFRLDESEELFPVTNRFAFLGRFRYALYRIARILIRRLKRLPFLRDSFVHFSFDGKNSRACSPGNPSFVEQVKARRFTFVEGWPYLEEMTLPHSDLIRAVFTPSLEVSSDVADYIKQAKRNADFLVGVHIRRGDYEHHLDGRYNYSTKQYAAAMTQTARLLAPARVVFLVCSNVVQSEADFEPLAVTLGQGTLLGDLYGLALCDYIIGPPSTYSLWAAFYGRRPFYCLMRADVPSTLEDFVVPDGHFECIQTVMDTAPRP